MAKTPIAPNPVEHPNPHDIPGEVRTGGKPAACPLCDADVSHGHVIGGLVPCPGCGRTLVLEQGSARLAKSEDVMGLTDAQRADLRKARPAQWRKDQQAKMRAVRGRS